MVRARLKNKTIFMTGGSGFIGSSIAERLVDKNKIIIYDNCRRFSPLLKGILRHKNLTFIKGDVLDAKKLGKSMPGKPDIVMHLAAIAGVSSYYKMPAETMTTNIIGAHNVLNALRGKRLKRYVNFSTSEIYARHADRVREDGETVQGEMKERRWTYSLSKLAAEKLSFCHYWERKLPVVSIRPFNVYGPGQVGEGAIQIFITRALKNKNIYITGNGRQVRAWCYIDDLIGGVFACLRAKKAVGNTFNIGNDKAAITMVNLARMVISLAGSKSRIYFRPHVGTDIDLRVPNIEKAKRMLKYKPHVSLEKGLAKTIEWHKKL